MADYFKINNICAKYGDIQVLWDVNISVAKGEIVALVGSNGAGKTTTVRNAAGLMIPSSGSIEFDGANMTGKRSAEYAEAGIILVPEGRQLFPEMTVYENLELAAKMSSASSTGSRFSRREENSSPARCPAANSRWSHFQEA